ncbi:TetR/AcrR family transcriptional regulator [Cohnella endophytica]|uniref:TetR/AcrR family transcriptional regulator n=1 Tax=Cohnella endophytica TaxID=2419778 RepID=A0A494Y3Q4_9BACL|nr:TetR-like C-terminal domain-containing protein [Cohnella endophytica]RKP55121.1 TetR/AcrR family transcriptional regulator [Cohnella endophytica]
MRAGIKPETVIAAAGDIADREGWDQVTLANVAGNLGIRTPSLYNHVDGLQDLRQKLAIHASGLLLARLTDAAVGRTGEQAFIALGIVYVEFVSEHPGLYDAINRLPLPGPVEFEHNAEQILKLFIRLMEPLGLPESEFVHAIRGLRSMVHGFASLKSMGGFQMQEELYESVTKSITYYIQGLSVLFLK